MATDQVPDLIIADVMMPVMDGFEMCRKIKGDVRTSHIPVILLTAKDTKENLLDGLSHGADDYLVKPFHMPELLLRIRNLLARQQKLKEHLRQTLSEIKEPEIPVQDIFIIKLHGIIEKHLDDPQFSVDVLASEAGMSRAGQHRKLKAISGLTATEIIRNYRISRAAQILQQGYTSSDAAYKTGFSSPAYFSKCFKDVLSVTPSEYIHNMHK